MLVSSLNIKKSRKNALIENHCSLKKQIRCSGLLVGKIYEIIQFLLGAAVIDL